MNRPFGAVDVAANLKGAVPKTATQKILVSLAEKGALTQKTYGTLVLTCASFIVMLRVGKTTFFVINQANMEHMPPEKLKTLEEEHKAIEEENKALKEEVEARKEERKKVQELVEAYLKTFVNKTK